MSIIILLAMQAFIFSNQQRFRIQLDNCSFCNNYCKTRVIAERVL